MEMAAAKSEQCTTLQPSVLIYYTLCGTNMQVKTPPFVEENGLPFGAMPSE